MKRTFSERDGARALQICLSEVPFISSIIIVQEPNQVGHHDLIATFKVNGEPTTIVAEVKTNGQPRLARDAVNQLLRIKTEEPAWYPVFIAPYISPESAGICQDAGIGYLDLAGNAYLAFDRLFIRREGRKNPFVSTRALKSLYHTKSSRVIRVMLCNPGRIWRINDLRLEADVSIGLTSNVKRMLIDREWVDESRNGIILTRPEALLDGWSKQYSFSNNKIISFYSLDDPADIEEKLVSQCGRNEVRYAFTSFSAAARYAPAVRYRKVAIYIDSLLSRIAEESGLKPVTSGANVLLAVPYDEGVFYGCNDSDGVVIANPVQVYLDLIHRKDRGREAAEMLRKQVLEMHW